MNVSARPRDLPPFTVRPAKLSDAAALAKLATELGYPSTTRQVEQRMNAVRRDSKHFVLVAESAGSVVGWAHAYLCCLIESDLHAELGGLVVDEAHRDRGVGGELLEKVEEWARQKGCSAVTVRSNITRTAAHKFYAARGYAQIKTQLAFRKPL
jgi:N-acetylglutamate synthase-like GNAT family acetyltransferase